MAKHNPRPAQFDIKKAGPMTRRTRPVASPRASSRAPLGPGPDAAAVGQGPGQLTQRPAVRRLLTGGTRRRLRTAVSHLQDDRASRNVNGALDISVIEHHRSA